jgi:hypothetical protein
MMKRIYFSLFLFVVTLFGRVRRCPGTGCCPQADWSHGDEGVTDGTKWAVFGRFISSVTKPMKIRKMMMTAGMANAAPSWD